jgi:hypothetical protein
MERYYQVTSDRAQTLHRAKGKVEGDSTYCGTLLTCAWRWTAGKMFLRIDRKKPRCKRCYS